MSGGRQWRRKVVAALLAGTAAPMENEAEHRKASERAWARMAWSRARLDDMKRAQEALDAAWMELLEPYRDWDDDELPDIPDPPEEEAFQRIWFEIMAAIELDRWPRQLHWPAI